MEYRYHRGRPSSSSIPRHAPVTGPHARRDADSQPPDLAIFAATSGHSGVDRVIRNLVPELAGRGFRVDLLRIRNHGPRWDGPVPGVRLVDLPASHVNTAFPALVLYLRRYRPRAMLTDKDRVNRAAIAARALSRSPTRLAVRLGTTVSLNLAHRSRADRWLQTWSMRHLYRRADVVITPSAGAAADLAGFAGLPRERVIAIDSPVMTDQVLALARSGPPHPWLRDRECPVVLGVGELSRRKDFATLIRGFAALRRQRPARLIILGEGGERTRLEALAAELGVAEHVDMPGFVDNPYPFMAHADVFALTSRWEGSPVVLMEAVALGTPSVATDCPSGPRETLDDGRLGGLVPVGDAEAVTRALEEALTNPVDRDELRRAGQRFTAARSADRYLQALGLA